MYDNAHFYIAILAAGNDFKCWACNMTWNRAFFSGQTWCNMAEHLEPYGPIGNNEAVVSCPSQRCLMEVHGRKNMIFLLYILTIQQ